MKEIFGYFFSAEPGFFGSAFWERFLGAVLTGRIGLIFWRVRMIDGGDQKLMMAVGAFVGQTLALSVVLAAAVFGGLEALISILFARGSTGIRSRLKTLHIPYSLTIAPGTGMVMLLNELGITFSF